MKKFKFIAFFILGAWSMVSADPLSMSMDLSGQWHFRLDPDDAGITEKWCGKKLPDTIHLPGSLQEQGYGHEVSAETEWTIKGRNEWLTEPRYEKYRQPGNIKMPYWLQPDKHYVGAAWYQRTIVIPDNWKGKRVALNLERTHWTTRVWLNKKEIGKGVSLSAPHLFDLGSDLAPGTYSLTILVDNRMFVDVGANAHSVSEHTQSNWNGIVGKINLTATESVWIENVQIYPDVEKNTILVRVNIGNKKGKTGKGVINLSAKSRNGNQKHEVPAKDFPVSWTPEGGLVEVNYELGKDALLWDEYSPALYDLNISLLRNGKCISERKETTGLRELKTNGRQFEVNGRRLFLRGTLECSIFPLTGYPSTKVEDWKRIIRICKEHGLNHIRFHSWCPPDAAFVAADELGFYYQVECGGWTKVGAGKPIDQWLYNEGAEIIKAYGNHPSFAFFAYGNEPGGKGKGDYLPEWVRYWKKTDSRRLHTAAAGWPMLADNQYQNSPRPRLQSFSAGLRSKINSLPPEMRTDYTEFVNRFECPVVTHEMGQWCVYPDFNEIPKYKGYLKAKNFEMFQEFLEEKHMLDQARDFQMASGALQVLCYKADIEAALRTPDLGGFQLLDLHDFPGQGTALVGILDAFWDSKPYVSAKEYRRFCSETVPLAKMDKMAWTTDETFSADIEVAHFAEAPLDNARSTWSLSDTSGKIVASGKFPARDISLGNGISLGRVDFPLNGIKAPQKLNLEVTLPGTTAANDWDFWVYPAKLKSLPENNILITSELDAKAKKALANGKTVWLALKPEQIKTDAQIGFTTIFWNTAWTNHRPPHSMGILCDPNHPAFLGFPTESHSNWQWWHIVSHSAMMNLDAFPADLKPVIQVVPDWHKPEHLALAFEAKVGKGKLFVTSIDLESDLDANIVARQMRNSFLNYLSSKFNPKTELTIEEVNSLISD